MDAGDLALKEVKEEDSLLLITMIKEIGFLCVINAPKRMMNDGQKDGMIIMDLSSIEIKIKNKEDELRIVEKQKREELLSLQTSEEYLESVQEAQVIVQSIVQTIQETAHKQIAGVVSSCLSTVFDEPYIFKINFEQKRGRTEANLKFERGGMEVDPLTASGGGVVDVAAFALRVSCLMLSKPAVRRLIIMDEPFKFVSAEYRENIKIMLEELSEKFNIQMIMVTHIDELKTGKVIRIE